MHLKKGYVVKEVAGESVLFPSGQEIIDSGKLVSVNETGRFIIDLLQEEIPYLDLLQKMAEQYEPDDEEERFILQADLDRFLNLLSYYGLLEE